MTYIESMRNFVRQSKQRPEMEQTSKDVWGAKVVRLFEKDGVVSKEIVPLECWFVQYEVQSGDTIQAVKEAVLQKVIEFERRKFNELDSGDYICEQLDDWNFAFTPNGMLLCDGKVTMTKYAVIVRREAEK